MKKSMINFAGMMFLVGLLSFATMNVKAENLASYITDENILTNVGDQDFILVNGTNVEIYALYVTPHTAKDWGDDVLGIDTLMPGESATITFAPRERVTYWDLRVEDEDGNYIEWDKFNLKKISTIELYYKNGKATAIFN